MGEKCQRQPFSLLPSASSIPNRWGWQSSNKESFLTTDNIDPTLTFKIKLFQADLWVTLKSVLWDYIFFKFFLWLIGNQAQSSAVNEVELWSQTYAWTHARILFYRSFFSSSAIHMSDYYINSHTPAKLTFGHH